MLIIPICPFRIGGKPGNRFIYPVMDTKSRMRPAKHRPSKLKATTRTVAFDEMLRRPTDGGIGSPIMFGGNIDLRFAPAVLVEACIKNINVRVAPARVSAEAHLFRDGLTLLWYGRRMRQFCKTEKNFMVRGKKSTAAPSIVFPQGKRRYIRDSTDSGPMIHIESSFACPVQQVATIRR